MEPRAVPFTTVSRSEKRLERIRTNPSGVDFDDLVACVESCGFQRVSGRSGTSHGIYRHPGPPVETLNLQPRPDGKAKAYQVREFIDAWDRINPEESP